MSEITTPTDESIELPSKAEVGRWMNELEARGVPAELECGKCGDLTETTVPPEAKDDETQKTICRGCMTDHLREKNLL